MSVNINPQERKAKIQLTYQEAKDYLNETPKKGILFGLEPIGNLLDELGNPQDDLKFVHLAGTNGKGSVLSYTASILTQAGYRTGQYTSPALISRREQMQVNGEWITKEKYARLVMEVKAAITRLEGLEKALPTVYEVETAMAFLYFKKEKCDIVVLETGMGGRDDATNVVKNTLVAGFTSISLDHMSFLGETIEEIAAVKARIIKPISRVVSGIQKPSVLGIIHSTMFEVYSEGLEHIGADKDSIERQTHEQGAVNAIQSEEVNTHFTFVSEDNIKSIEEAYNMQRFIYKDSEPYTIQMAGRHQVENAAVAIEIIKNLQELGFKISCEDIRQGLAKTRFFGRFTPMGEKPIFIVDGAHNENGVLRLRENISRLFPHQKITFIMGIYKDKMVDKIVETMLPLAESVYTVSLPNKERTITAKELKEICENWSMENTNENPRENSKENAIEDVEEDANENAKADVKRDAKAGVKRDTKADVEKDGRLKRDLKITPCTSIKEAVKLSIECAGEEGVVIAFGSLSYLWPVASFYEEERRLNNKTKG